MSRYLVRLEAAGKRYPPSERLWTHIPGHRAFGPVTLELQHNERVALIGRSGAGKSTLGRCLAGLEPITEGNLVLGEGLFQRHGAVPPFQMVFQDSPTAMNPHWTIAAILREPMRLSGRAAGPSELVQALHRVGLNEDLLARRPAQLSGGQRRRILLARALAMPDLRLLILDEPLAGLDAASARAIRSLLSELQAALPFALLLITHDLASVGELADRVLVMANGLLVEEQPAHLFPRTAKHPESRALLDAILPEVRA